MDYYINLPTELKAIVKSFMPSHIMNGEIKKYNKKLNNDPKKINFIEDGEIFYKKVYNDSFYHFIRDYKLNKVYTHSGDKTSTHKWLSDFKFKHKNLSNEFMIKEIYKIKQQFKLLPEKEYSIYASKKPEEVKRRRKDEFRQFIEKHIYKFDDKLYQQIILKYPIQLQSWESLEKWESYVSNEYHMAKLGYIKNNYTEKESICLVKY
jgi:hypothetical protein